MHTKAGKTAQERQTAKRKDNPGTPERTAKRVRPQSRSPNQNKTNYPPPGLSVSPGGSGRRVSERRRTTVQREGYVRLDEALMDDYEAPDSPMHLIRPFQDFASHVTTGAQTDASTTSDFALTSEKTAQLEQPQTRATPGEDGPSRAYPLRTEPTSRRPDLNADTTQPPRVRPSSPQYPAPEAPMRCESDAPADPPPPQYPVPEAPMRWESDELPHQPQPAVTGNTDGRLRNEPSSSVDPVGQGREQSTNPQTSRPRNPVKLRIEFIYRIILSRSPKFSYRLWYPTRKLEETTLGQFVDDLGLAGDAKGVIFTVEGPNFQAEEQLFRDDEIRFAAFVRQIKRAIRVSLGNGQGIDAPLVFEVEIEPMQALSLRGYEEYDDDFVI